jgi:hypothetical protein
VHFCITNTINYTIPRNIQIPDSQQHLVFKNWQCVLLEDDTCVPKHVGDAYLMFVLIKNVHLVDIINGVWCFTVP